MKTNRLVMFMCAFIASVFASSALHAYTLTVTGAGDGAGDCTLDQANDTGVCPTLRAAIAEVNRQDASHRIVFAIQSAEQYKWISVSSGLPPIIHPVAIDADSQARNFPDTYVVLNGNGAVAVGLQFESSSAGSQLNNMAITRFLSAGIKIETDYMTVSANIFGSWNPDGSRAPRVTENAIDIIGSYNTIVNNMIGDSTYGVRISGFNSVQNRVKGNYFGTNFGGAEDYANDYGVYISDGAHDNFIGEILDRTGNYFAHSNKCGIFIYGANDNQIWGNVIGATDPQRSQAGWDNSYGIWIKDSSGNTVGSSLPWLRNAISGNSLYGIMIQGTVLIPEKPNRIEGNLIGTDLTGMSPFGNRLAGILIANSVNNVIGGSSLTRNIISGNQYGIWISGGADARTEGNIITSNYIGTDIDGKKMGTSRSMIGILISGLSNMTIGGTLANDGNVISGFQSGIHVSTSGGNRIWGNRIGTDASGNEKIGNDNGIVLAGAHDNIIGGTEDREANLISGNSIGISFFTDSANKKSQNNLVRGNYIGTDFSAGSALGNIVGIYLNRGDANQIEMNNISGNDTGVKIESESRGNRVFGNSIGIDAARKMVMPNSTRGIYLGVDDPSTAIGGASDSDKNVIYCKDSAFTGSPFLPASYEANNVILPCHEQIHIDASGYSVLEKDGSVRIFVVRDAGDDGTINVNYATRDGTAVAGRDYGARSGFVAFADRDIQAKAIDIDIYDDRTRQGDRTFTISLTGGIIGVAEIGPPSEATITIVDDEFCGDGIPDASEECDDGNNADDDGCSGTCKRELAACGDNAAQRWAGEECDDGNNADDDGCSGTCKRELAACGDSVAQRWAGEECDDGNAVTEKCPCGQAACSVCDENCRQVSGAVSECPDTGVKLPPLVTGVQETGVAPQPAVPEVGETGAQPSPPPVVANPAPAEEPPAEAQPAAGGGCSLMPK